MYFFSRCVRLFGVLNDSSSRVRTSEQGCGRLTSPWVGIVLTRSVHHRVARVMSSPARELFKQRDLSKPPTSALTLYCTVLYCTVILTRTCTLSSRVSDRPDRSVGTHNNQPLTRGDRRLVVVTCTSSPIRIALWTYTPLHYSIMI